MTSILLEQFWRSFVLFDVCDLAINYTVAFYACWVRKLVEKILRPSSLTHSSHQPPSQFPQLKTRIATQDFYLRISCFSRRILLNLKQRVTHLIQCDAALFLLFSLSFCSSRSELKIGEGWNELIIIPEECSSLSGTQASEWARD